MKHIILLCCFNFSFGYSQEIDTSFYFNMNDSILEANGVNSFNNEFLVNKKIEKKEDFTLKFGHSKDTLKLIENIVYYYIAYDYDIKEFGKFSLQSILGISKNSKKLCYVYYEPNSYIFLKNTNIEQWNKKTFDLSNIISVIESRKEIKFKSTKTMEFSVQVEGNCKDVFFIKNQFGRYKDYTLSLEAFYKDSYINTTERIILSGCNYVDYDYDDSYYYPLYILNNMEFIEVNFTFETESEFFRPNNKQYCKKKIDYNVFRFHQIKLSFSEHIVLSDGLFSIPSGIEH